MNNGAKIAIVLLLLYLGGFFVRTQTVTLKHFKPREFGIWWPLMNPDLLEKLDRFRSILGKPVRISPAIGALGRPQSPTSQHFPDPLVGAVDVMIGDDVTFEEAYRAARNAGFTGIGLYPDWKPMKGLHLDNRPDRTPANPATWSGYDDWTGKQVYAGIDYALNNDRGVFV